MTNSSATSMPCNLGEVARASHHTLPRARELLLLAHQIQRPREVAGKVAFVVTFHLCLYLSGEDHWSRRKRIYSPFPV